MGSKDECPPPKISSTIGTYGNSILLAIMARWPTNGKVSPQVVPLYAANGARPNASITAREQAKVKVKKFGDPTLAHLLKCRIPMPFRSGAIS